MFLNLCLPFITEILQTWIEAFNVKPVMNSQQYHPFQMKPHVLAPVNKNKRTQTINKLNLVGSVTEVHSNTLILTRRSSEYLLQWVR